MRDVRAGPTRFAAGVAEAVGASTDGAGGSATPGQRDAMRGVKGVRQLADGSDGHDARASRRSAPRPVLVWTGGTALHALVPGGARA